MMVWLCNGWDVGFDSGFCFLCVRVSDYYGGGIYGSHWCWVLKDEAQGYRAADRKEEAEMLPVVLYK